MSADKRRSETLVIRVGQPCSPEFVWGPAIASVGRLARQAIPDGRQPKGLRLAEMLGNGPVEWEEQRGAWRLQP